MHVHFLLLLSVLFICCLAGPTKLGGYTHKSPKLEDPSVFKAVRTCVEHVNDSRNTHFKMNDFDVVSVQMKVVAGIIYKIHLSTPLGDGTAEHFKFEVFRDFSSDYVVQKFDSVGILPMD
ncbi:hypothetical protein RCL1_008005 [Eukaryota sp. TZLM3-RCL]